MSKGEPFIEDSEINESRHVLIKEKKSKRHKVEKQVTEKETRKRSIGSKIKGFLKEDTSTKVGVILQGVTILVLVPLLGITGKIFHQTSEEPFAVENGSSSIMEFTNQTNILINQVLRGNASNAALVELANRVIAMNNGLNEEARVVYNATQNASLGITSIETVTAEEVERSQNESRILKQLIEATIRTSDKIKNISATVSTLNNDATSTTAVINELLTVTNELSRLYNETSHLRSQLPISCKDIKTRLPNSATGYYIINNRTFYCDMDTLCGSGGGWTRLAYLDMSDSTQNCPSGFRLYQSGGVRACGRPVTNGPSCASVQFPSNGISYSQICGRVTGYQYASPDAIGPYYAVNKSHQNDLNAPYVDGVSITRGSPRKHVWTLMAGVSEIVPSNDSCPCSNMTNVQVQSFIGNDYYCESGNPNLHWSSRLYTSDPLWDGEGCGGFEADCCNVTGLPWFHRDYGTNTTTDFLELRVCGDEGTRGEGNPVGFYEIYVI